MKELLRHYAYAYICSRRTSLHFQMTSTQCANFEELIVRLEKANRKFYLDNNS
jgi:hypothetical protein